MPTVKWLLSATLVLSVSVNAFSQFIETENAHKHAVDSLQDLLLRQKEDTSKAKSLIALSTELYDWDEEERPLGLKYARQALDLARQINYKKGMAEAYFIIGGDSFGQGKNEEAKKHFSSALSLMNDINDIPGIIKGYCGMAQVYEKMNENQKAVSSFNQALTVAEKSRDPKNIMGVYGALGMYYYDMQPPQYSEALKSYLMAYKLAIENKSDEYIWGFGNNLGLIYFGMGDYQEALHVLNTIKTQTGKGAAIGNLSYAYIQLGMYNDAIQLYRNSLHKSRSLNNIQLRCYGLGQIGLAYYEMAESKYKAKVSPNLILGNLDSALWYFDSSKYISDTQKLITGFPPTEMNFGNVHKMKALIFINRKADRESIKSELQLANQYFRQGLQKTEESQDKTSLPEYYLKMGETKFELSKYESSGKANESYLEALNLFGKGLDAAQGTSNKPFIRDAYKGIFQVYNKLGDSKKSMEYFKWYDDMRDTVAAEESRKKLDQIKFMGETILGATEEKARHDKVMTELNFEYEKREDSLNYLQGITDEKLKRQTLLTSQQEKDLLLKQASLDLANNEIELTKLNYLKSQAELSAEQSQRLEKEKQLTIAEQEKKLQASHLKLQETELILKENELVSTRKQRLFYLGGLVLMGSLFFFVYRNIRTRQKAKIAIANEKLKFEKASAAHKMIELELQSLRAQLNPHFMFNSLNAIQELILKEDTDKSQIYLSHFSDLLRMLLDNASQPLIPLRNEIALLEFYLSLEKLRIPELEYTFTIDPKIDMEESMIPNMILQPYIENSIWHGLSTKKGSKKISLRIRKQLNVLHFEIEDNGIGREKAKELKGLYRKEHKSLGMELLSKRFALMSREYETTIQTEVFDLRGEDGSPRGTRVEITIPQNIKESLNLLSNDPDYHY